MKKVVPAIIVLLFTVALACAETGIDNENIRYVPGDGITIKALDFDIKPETTLVLQGVPDPNRGGYGGQLGASWVVYLDVIKRFGDDAFAFCQLKTGLGNTVDGSLNLFNKVNYNSYDVGGNVRLRKYYYAQHLLERQLIVQIGHANSRDYIDQVKYASNDDIQFLQYIFNRSPSIDWPDNYMFFVHLNASPKAVDFLQFEYNYWEGDADWRKIMKNAIHTFQINLLPANLFDLDASKWEGNYRLYTWLDTRKHTKFVLAGQPPSINTKELNYGLGLGFDQMLGEVVGVFGRFGWQRPDVEPAHTSLNVGITWSGGFQIKGNYWKRDGDVLGFAVGQVFPSRQWTDSAYDNHGAAEGHIEVYYSYAITDYMQISPDFQLVWNPDGVTKKSGGDTDPVFLYGTRFHVKF